LATPLLRTIRAALATLALAVACVPGAFGQQLYKCGATYQDRPCSSEDVQKRFSHTSGNFSINQVNPDTDKDCAVSAAETLPYWERMNAGHSLDQLKAEIDAKPISRFEKSRVRDGLIALRNYRGTPKEVRSQLESECMNQKRARGIPTEKDNARANDRAAARRSSYETRARVAEERVAVENERQYRMEQERAAMIEQMNERRAAVEAARAAARERAAAARAR
jgi:hypothetical protein